MAAPRVCGGSGGPRAGQDGRVFAYALEFPMDIMTSGPVAGMIVIATMVFLGGDLHMFSASMR